MPKYKVDITESGGVSQGLKNAMMKAFKKSEYYILCEEGGDGTNQHYHLHGILESNYTRTDNLRRRVFKKVYKEADVTMTNRSLVIKLVSDLEGALAYCYKEKRVLCHSGIMLDRIRPWKKKSQKHMPRKKRVRVTRTNFNNMVIWYCEEQGITPKSALDVRNVITDMMKDGYSIIPGNWVRGQVADILAYFGEVDYAKEYLDEMLRIFA